MHRAWPDTDVALIHHLSEHGVPPTLQRLAIADVMLRGPCRLSADQVLDRARERQPELSAATVDSVLALLVSQRLLRQHVDADRAVVYDSDLR